MMAAVRVGCLVALLKPNARVRALVADDVFRCVVARAVAQHFAAALQAIPSSLHDSHWR